MRNLITIILTLFVGAPAFAQDLNKVVFGPLEGDNAGILTVHNDENIEIEMWVRTDPDNPAPIMGVMHSLMSADSIIASRDGATFDPDYSYPCWDTLVTPPMGHDDDEGIPEGHTMQAAGLLFTVFDPPCDSLDTNGEWDYFGSFLMTCNTDVPIDETYYPFSEGWFPHSGQGTVWSFDVPPGGSIIPDQDFCGLYFEPDISIDTFLFRPRDFMLGQNYPNPFNATTTIRYSLPEECQVSIQVFDILGRNKEMLISEYQHAGWHAIVWEAGDNRSGIYFYRFQAGEYSETKSCILLK